MKTSVNALGLLPPLAETKKIAPPPSRARMKGARAEVVDEAYDEDMRRSLAERALGPVQAKSAVNTGYGDLIAAVRTAPARAPGQAARVPVVDDRVVAGRSAEDLLDGAARSARPGRVVQRRNGTGREGSGGTGSKGKDSSGSSGSGGGGHTGRAIADFHGNVLVVGCGRTGGVCEEHNPHPPDQHYVIDIRPEAQPDLVADFTQATTLPGGRFQMVYFENVDLDVFTRPQTYLNAMHVLAPGGQLIIQTGSGQLIIDDHGHIRRGPGPAAVLDTLEHYLRQAGFVVADEDLFMVEGRPRVVAKARKPIIVPASAAAHASGGPSSKGLPPSSGSGAGGTMKL